MFFRLCMLGLLWIPVSAAQAIQIEASIKPLAMLIEPLLLDGDRVSVLLKPGASPHHYALKASDLQRINSADLVVWTGPELERFLQKPLRAKPAQQLLALSELEEIHWPHLDTKELEFDHSAAHNHSHGHEHGDQDPHFWLDPVNAKRIAQAVSERLISINPTSEEAYKKNLDTYLAVLEELNQTLSTNLQPSQNVGFVVFHRGYDHFVGRYHLDQLAYITLSPEQKPGARHLYQLRKNLAGQAKCVFIEANSNSQAAKSLATDLGISTAVLDPLGVESDSYYNMMMQMGATVSSCLTANNEPLAR